jgi:hypothetical protein
MPKDAIGLTDQESRVLNELASKYAAELGTLSEAERRLIFEMRMRMVGSENPSAQLSDQLEELDGQRSRLVLDYFHRLEAAFGDSRFRTLNDWVLSRAKARTFFPLVADPNNPVPQVKKAVVAK